MSSATDILDMMRSHEFLTVFGFSLITLLVLRFFFSKRQKKKHHHHHHRSSRTSFGSEGAVFSTMLWFLVSMLIVAFAFYFLYVSLLWLQSP